MVAEHFNIDTADIIGNKRSTKVVRPRQICMYLCREYTNIALKNIGEFLGGRDHSTVLHGINKIEEVMAEDESVRNTIHILKMKIDPQSS